ncbi:methyltransferase [Stigmatella sp. ncwal1]|uniref:Methyltransferase n=1 Tax=Stigmatella ashevillensis TaxID=2995309 RepID=A0ABT5D200_9BACT|nr:methyltransferase [Stigmatella ashevillena]MDC0707120.1 methyltransferase [Stigmatella ashevillena]
MDPTPPPNPSQQLLEHISSYWISQIIGVVARLRLSDLLASGPLSSDALAPRVGANPDGLYRLMRAGVVAGLFTEVPPRTFTLTPLGACLRSEVPGSMRDMAIMMTAPGHWRPWGELFTAVQTGRSTALAALGANIWEHYEKNPEEALHFDRAMGSYSSFVATEVARLHDFSPYARVADVGGSQGVLLAAVLRVYPSCRGILFDLPHVIDGARAQVEAEGLSQRMDLVAGSFFEPVIPAAEAYLLKHILHDWDDASSTAILRQIHRAALPGARLIVVEMVMPDSGEPSRTALMDLNMFVLADGRERTAREYEALLASTGWALERITSSPSGVSLIEARKPKTV